MEYYYNLPHVSEKFSDYFIWEGWYLQFWYFFRQLKMLRFTYPVGSTLELIVTSTIKQFYFNNLKD